MKKYRTIGIIGGMGPAATADLYNRIISIFQKRFGAKYDSDFPEIIIISLPIPDVVERMENEKLAVEMLVGAARRLEAIGCELIAIPCNSAHAYLPQLREAVKVNVVSIIDEAASSCRQQNSSRVGILATRLTLNKELYDAPLSGLGIGLVKPGKKEQELLTKLIMRVLEGKVTKSGADCLGMLINGLKRMGADTVVLGCTELGLLMDGRIYGVKLIDSTQVLAEACVREATKVI